MLLNGVMNNSLVERIHITSSTATRIGVPRKFWFKTLIDLTSAIGILISNKKSIKKTTRYHEGTEKEIRF